MPPLGAVLSKDPHFPLCLRVIVVEVTEVRVVVVVVVVVVAVAVEVRIVRRCILLLGIPLVFATGAKEPFAQSRQAGAKRGPVALAPASAATATFHCLLLRGRFPEILPSVPPPSSAADFHTHRQARHLSSWKMNAKLTAA